MEQAILAESARWGDAWFEEPINEDDWRQGSDSVLGQMTGNTARLLDQVRARGYYPLLDPPAFSQENANFTGQLSLAMIAGQGDIYFTTDGSDPRVQVTGAINPVALRYAGPIDLNTSTRVRARAYANGVWSALHEADFVNAEQPSGLRVTKLMYNPAGGDDYEFLELTNLGSFEVDLSGARFDGLDLRFPYPTRLAGGSSVMLVADAAAFRERYGNANVAAEYGGELADSGERITLRSASDKVLLSLSYDDENEWPLTPDGRGDLLVLENAAGDMNDPASWRANVAGDVTPAAGTGVSRGVNDANVQRGREPMALDPFAAQPSNVTDIRFGDDLNLAGYDAYLNGRPLAGEKLPALRPGDILEYVLYWQRGQFKGKYAYIKLLTPSQELVAQADRDVGLSLQPLDEGPSAALVPDRYTLTIPPGATVGVVQPDLYVWVPDTSTRLPILSNEGASLGQDYQLPALKIYPSGPVPAPQHLLRARFGDQIELLGYAVDSPETAMRAGQPITVTLWFKTETPLDKGLVRSLQLHSAEHGMAAQDDSEPARRDNPTWAWQPGEVVVDEVRLEVQPGAPAGRYRLMLAMYDPADVRRLPVRDEAGNSLPDQILQLQDIVLAP